MDSHPADDDAASRPDWVGSGLVQAVLGGLDRPRTVDDLAEDLGVTDTRIARYLDALAGIGLTERGPDGWLRTDAGAGAVGEHGSSAADGVTELPGASVQDYRQALVDLEFGMFDPEARWASAEHGARLRPERAAEFTERLQALVAEYFGPDSVDWSSPVKYGFRWVLTPVDLPPGGAVGE